MGEAEISDTQRKGATREWSKLDVVAAEGKAKDNKLWVRSCFKLFGSSQVVNAHIHTHIVILKIGQCWDNWTPYAKTKNLDRKKKNFKKEKRDLDRDLTPFTKINTKWIINLNVKFEPI